MQPLLPVCLCFSVPMHPLGFSHHLFGSKKYRPGLIDGCQSWCVLGLVQFCMMGNNIGMHGWLSGLSSKRVVGFNSRRCCPCWCMFCAMLRLRQRYLQCQSLLHVRMSCSGGHSRRRVWFCNASCFLLFASAFLGC